MRKILSAIILCFIFAASTAAHITEPIKPVDQALFKPIEVVELVEHGEKRIPTVVKAVPSPSPSRTETAAKPKPKKTSFKLDPEVSWYGPHFYGKRTACGQKYTKEILGVAHRTLPCGTKVTFHWKGKTLTVPVIDRGPYVRGRQWDLSGGLCVALKHCFTGKIYYRINK